LSGVLSLSKNRLKAISKPRFGERSAALGLEQPWVSIRFAAQPEGLTLRCAPLLRATLEQRTA